MALSSVHDGTRPQRIAAAANLSAYSSVGPQRVTSVGFDDIAMCDFEAKLASYLVDKR
jgi:hypothetical protein